jgi:hypothetical protein
MKVFLESFLGALFGQIVEAINAWRRDKALEELGYTKAQRDLATGANDASRAADAGRGVVADNLSRNGSWMPDNDPNRRD